MQDKHARFSTQLPVHMPARFARVGAIALAVMVVAGCTVLQEDKIDYKSAKQGSTLDVPPDLTQLTRDSRYNVPGASSATASGQQAAQTMVEAGTTAVKSVGDVRIERAGGQRWLVIKRPAERLWDPVTEFWKENGFTLEIEQEKLGIMETSWAENRAKIPQDFIRSSIGKLFDGLYSSGERDKFRTRLERTADGSTEIYISHRGMAEVYTNAQKDATGWQPRSGDPELETEFLRRLMVKLGASAEQAKEAAAPSAAAQPVAQISEGPQGPVLTLNESFDLAWRRVGLTLDRTGFTVEDRDRANGTYYVRYVPSESAEGKKQGFFGRLFSSKAEAKPNQYRFKVSSVSGSTTVQVLDKQGQTAPKADAQSIVKLLADNLN